MEVTAGHVGGDRLVNPFTISGIVAGIVLGFLLGRRWAEYFRAERDAANIRAGQKNYRGADRAWYVGALLIIGGAIAYGYLVPA